MNYVEMTYEVYKNLKGSRGACKVLYLNGKVSYYINTELHRKDKPAITYLDGTKYYFLNDRRHRTIGPAAIEADGLKTYYLNGFQYSKERMIKELSNQELKEFLTNKENF